jgi:poly-gamma-glutamate synthesis protein (capsule biosynthesis protein)
VAFLAYSSILPFGYWADEKKPGCAPIRGFTVYEQAEPDQPGTPALIHSFAHAGDKAAMIKDIQKAKGQADIVMVSMHWGIHYKEGEIAMYQNEVGYAALDAGADVILGHHAHILKAIEIYKGKPIFYSLCNFVFDLELPSHVLNDPHRVARVQRLNPSWRVDPKYNAYPFPVDSRMTLGARIIISDKKIRKVSILPAYVNEDSSPRFLSKKDKEFSEVVSYMERITKAQGIDTQYQIEGDEVGISLD